MELRSKMKKMVKRLYAKNNRRWEDPLAKRARLAQRIALCAEQGEIAIVYGGRDCDGTVVRNQVRVVPAVVPAVVSFEKELYAEAEGPVWAELARPSDVADLSPTTRDLALEAFENEHPYSLHGDEHALPEVDRPSSEQASGVDPLLL